MGIILSEIKGTLKDASLTTFELLKIMIPVSIIVKIMKEFGIIEIVGSGLAPITELVGLPGDYGLVWATAMITNIYGGLIVFFNLAIENPLTIAQVTVLGVLILIAHNLPVEIRIAQKAGASLWFMLILRLSGAFLLGLILHLMFTFFNLYQTPSAPLWTPGYSDPSLLFWILGEVRTYLMIFLIILGLMFLMMILKKSGIIDRLNNLLEPGLKILGMSKNAAPVTMIGMTLGLAYGGGLIIKEAKSGILSKKDALLSLSLMGLSHGLIEDTLLLLAIGASLSGILLGRVVFTIAVMLILIKCINRLSKDTFHKFFVSR